MIWLLVAFKDGGSGRRGQGVGRLQKWSFISGLPEAAVMSPAASDYFQMYAVLILLSAAKMM